MPKIRMQPINTADVLLTDAFSEFMSKCRAKNLSDKTLEVYGIHFKIFNQFLDNPSFKVAEITQRTLDDFTLYLQRRGCNDVTVQSYIRDIRCYCYYFMEQGYTEPFKIKLPKADKKIKETYTDEELKRLLKKPNLKRCEFNEYKTWVFSNYLLATGNRISTVLNLKIRDLDFENGVIQLNKCKNRKAQIVPMSTSLAVILREYLAYRKGEADDYVFCNSYGGQGDIRSYQEMLAKYNKGRGVNKTSAHLYRHTFAKRWILNGGDIFRLQKLLGHSDLGIVKEYVNMFSRDLSKDYSEFNPLDTLGTVRNSSKVGF
ncbi:tyrosine-type recombinase/integrase [Intestinimonas butyriciproducens]|uniref:Integrase/recombinase XerD n=2 Tax=Intestinimonas butyriciproducens TaxID=1297617 RepID=A0A2U1BCX5_9FIRM|nr:tyrosine-type recombinase/integrase [Intestinimonas butyriciproducens]MBU5230924.1 tyrosine-type recombinase/integrase [Intestinimonas butyriciproducens]MCR1906841.1 tyrosine-type recombinase/integrase [Intestinimonas butyriciproducens]PVY46467.1 integrase/recombinase XerD [Intestinimonas butyriciproducens]QBB66693.1 integrase/recombinase [Intestinimonas butyriciproducens]